MDVFRSRPFMVVVIVCVIVGFVGAGAAALIPRGGGSGTADVTSLWQSQPEDVRSEVCSAFRANPQGYLALMEQTWLADGTLDQDSFETLVDEIATDCRVNY
ncbi:MAG: hypothetical protein VXW92_03685 [Actinomycetota bacterium]|nr:hypothetical protein [Micrococcales bacterium]MEC7102115.1 hypothetical protein [Actinomycetota bacterium]MEC7103562.1 hypothetical protein [Actinomycetota bacterium]MEC7590264.1 hypothetical protein [Actinomycetota bacterium]MEC8406898.1 hypothetical protein [Actinomycetota bacterium]